VVSAEAEVLEFYPEQLEKVEPPELTGPDQSLGWRLAAFLAAEQLADTDDLAEWFGQVRADRAELRRIIALAETRS
jgi:hypothetical protein